MQLVNLDRLCRRYNKAPWEVLEIGLVDYAIAIRVMEAGNAQDEIDMKKREREMQSKRRK